MADKEQRLAFLFLPSYYDALQRLSVKDRHTLTDAILDYAFAGTEPELPARLESFFLLIRPNIDSGLSRMRTSIENGKKGGRPRKQTVTEAADENPAENPSKNPDKNLGFDKSETPKNHEYEKEKENEIESEKENESESGIVENSRKPDPALIEQEKRWQEVYYQTTGRRYERPKGLGLWGQGSRVDSR